jgi:hypothetical protein
MATKTPETPAAVAARKATMIAERKLGARRRNLIASTISNPQSAIARALARAAPGTKMTYWIDEGGQRMPVVFSMVNGQIVVTR